MVSARLRLLLLLLMLGGNCSCTRPSITLTPTNGTASAPSRQAEPSVTQPVGQSNLLYHSQKTVVYTYHPDLNDMESAHLCLRRQGGEPLFLAQTGEQVRWFINAVALEEVQQVVFAQYLRANDLAEVWIIGFDGEGARRLLAAEDFVALGQGYARAIPRQMLALPSGNVLLSTAEFGYPAKALDDLYLLDTSGGTLTQLLVPGQAGQLILLSDSGQVLIQNSGQALVLDMDTLQISPASSALVDLASASPEALEKPPDAWLADCTP